MIKVKIKINEEAAKLIKFAKAIKKFYGEPIEFYNEPDPPLYLTGYSYDKDQDKTKA